MFRRNDYKHFEVCGNVSPLSRAARGFGFVAASVVFGALVLGGCSDDVQATPRVVFESQISPGTHSPKDCGKIGTWFDIGSFGNPASGYKVTDDPKSGLVEPARPVDDGAADQQGTVSIACSVTPKGDGFDVRASAQLSGATGGAMTISGLFRPTGDQNDITVSLSKRGETFTDLKCVARFSPDAGQGVAAGRIWATVECANAEYEDTKQICKSSSQFRFENCAQ